MSEAQLMFMAPMLSPRRYICNRQSGTFLYHNGDVSKFSDRIKMRRRALQLSQVDLARMARVSQTTISDIERGRNDGSRELVALAAALKVRPEWLNSGVGNMLYDEPNVIAGITLDGRKRIPLISYVQAGKWREIVDAYPPGGAEECVTPLNQHGPHAFALRVVGDSMLPLYTEGDVIIVDPDAPIRPGDCVVARNHHAEATFKKYRPRGRNAAGVEVFELVPLNPDYATLRSDVDSIVIIGRVVEHTRVMR